MAASRDRRGSLRWINDSRGRPPTLGPIVLSGIGSCRVYDSRSAAGFRGYLDGPSIQGAWQPATSSNPTERPIRDVMIVLEPSRSPPATIDHFTMKRPTCQFYATLRIAARPCLIEVPSRKTGCCLESKGCRCVLWTIYSDGGSSTSTPVFYEDVSMSVLSCAVSSTSSPSGSQNIVTPGRLSRRGCLLLLALGLLTQGCGGSASLGTVKIKGVVKHNGKALSSGTVTFNPTDVKNGRAAQGAIQPDGTFVLSTSKDGDGALPGTYNVTVTSTTTGTEGLAKDKGTGIGGKSAIPERYGSAATSQLSETIAAKDAGKSITLDLKD